MDQYEQGDAGQPDQPARLNHRHAEGRVITTSPPVPGQGTPGPNAFADTSPAPGQGTHCSGPPKRHLPSPRPCPARTRGSGPLAAHRAQATPPVSHRTMSG